MSTESVLIARPAVDVFDYVVDLATVPNWHLEVEALCEPVPAFLELGRPYSARFAPFLGEFEGTVTAIELEPERRLVLEFDFAGMVTRADCECQPEWPTGTRFTREVVVHPRGMLRLVSPLVARRVKRTNRWDVVQLKRILEYSHPRG